MSDENPIILAIKIAYFLSFTFLSSYIYYWGEIEGTVMDLVDETGWVPDGALASRIS